MKRTQAYLARASALFASLALAGVVYLVFVFPKTERAWAEADRNISTIERMLVNLSGFCQSFGLFLIPALLLVIVGCGVWAVLGGREAGPKAENRQLEGVRS